MPLLILSGFPGSGLSTRARELEKRFQERIGDEINKVVVVNDESLGIKKDVYLDKEQEKAARGLQMATVKRELSKDSLVILDSLAYIKGFRYQLFCEAKSINTASCVVHVGTPASLSAQFNKNRGPPTSESEWPQELFDALVFRYEEPNAMTRWDSPLFILLPEDPLPFDAIWDSLVLRKPVPPNEATKVKPAAPVNQLALLNDTTARIVKEVMDLHKDAPGSQVSLYSKNFKLPHRLTFPQLNRIRRNFVQLNKTALLPADTIEPFFIDFLEKNWHLD